MLESNYRTWNGKRRDETSGRRPQKKSMIWVLALQSIVFKHFFWLIRSLVDPPLAALIVCGPLQFILVTLLRTTPKINYDFIDDCLKPKEMSVRKGKEILTFHSWLNLANADYFYLMVWSLGFGGEIQLKIIHFVRQLIVHCSKSRYCLSVRIWEGGGGRYKGKNMSNYLDGFKMASCPFEAWWLFDAKPDRNYLCGAKNEKKILLRNTRLQRNGRRVLEVTT